MHELVVELSQTRSALNRVRAELQTGLDQPKNLQVQPEIAHKSEDGSRTQLQQTINELAAAHDEMVA